MHHSKLQHFELAVAASEIIGTFQYSCLPLVLLMQVPGDLASKYRQIGSGLNSLKHGLKFWGCYLRLSVTVS